MPIKKQAPTSSNHQEALLADLKKHFPEVFTEGKVDCTRLKQTLGEQVEMSDERYGLNWAGKSECFQHIQQPTTATLKPVHDESVNFDTTQNVFIEGENLEVLKILQKSYYNKVKMIYIDPPYNTGNDFIYNDDFKSSLEEYETSAGIRDEQGNRIKSQFFKNNKENGHYHSNWLSMMYPRLFLARNLLREDGVIFVSIDDNEVHNLRMVMDEVFGEDNFFGSFIWKSRQNVDSRALTGVSCDHEYVLCYGKTESTKITGKGIDQQKYKNPDNDPNGSWMSSALDGIATKAARPNLHYVITDPETGKNYSPNPDNGWRFQKSTMDILIANHQILWPKNPKSRPRFKRYLNKLKSLLTNYSTILDAPYTLDGTRELRDLMGMETVKFPKPVNFIKQLIIQGLGDSTDIIIDFFAGSGTTAHAVMSLNAEDGGNRKCVSVQLPESCAEDSEAFKAGYKTIADIAKERIRRAGKKILKDNEGKEGFDPAKLDIGFKVFKADQSNFKIWRTDIKDKDALVEQMKMFVDNVKKTSTQENILYELILKNGFDVDVAIEKKKVADGVFFSIDGGKLIICLEEKFTKPLIKAIIEAKPVQFICLDRSFSGNDQLKTNTMLQCEAGKIDFKVI